MLKYEPQKLGYKKFVRSTAPNEFQEFDKPNVAIGWIDLLGVRDFNHDQIVNAVEVALQSGVEGSCTGPVDQNGILYGKPNTATQFCLVGDALLVVEKDQPKTQAAAKLAFYYRMNLLSRFLNERGLIHRGVLTSGPIKCFAFEGTSLITGGGVLKAAMLEKTLKVAGLFYDESVVSFLGSRAPQMTRQSVYVPFSTLTNFNSTALAPGLAGACFSQFEGWEYWKQIIAGGDQTSDKVINASNVIRQIQTVHSLS
ncbi:MAG: hypothetical protein JNM39_09790 [Bdellovibrionaceae bacterium]|nr:hypothetical protein [Pseudobdellovibrionaceae bacterium]